MEFKFIGKLFRGDKVIWCIFIALCIISLLEVFSASSTIVYRQQNQFAPIFRHAVFLLFGFGLVVFLQRIPSRFFSILLLGIPVSAILIILTYFFGEDINGAQRWLGIGAITIQPSELAKISAIGFIAFFLSKMKTDNEGWIFWTMIISISILCALIVPDNLSTAILLFVVCFLLMFIGQVDLKRLAKVGLGVVILGLIAYGGLVLLPADVVKKYLPERAETWKNRIERHDEKISIKEVDENGNMLYKITDENRQVSHAKIAIADNKIIGLPGSGTQRDFLPQAYSDFIFAIILEEMGLLGGLFVLLLYLSLMIRCGVLASKCEKKFPRYLILGSALIITIQALANMAVAVNLIPVTGQPLPLVSRGGTSTIITCAYFGIILACSSRLNEPEHEHEEHVDESIANVEKEGQQINEQQ
ncbi:FtsW/RodA/SpoVE family cell cycle protein [Dysgonomonas sp. 511]|uniref:FtsW/RodA/SpoVE family cell cycle protein n=1 Tax=Dysgonomonas sp. 511 TaxID=2302930 RepID=UPI0013D3A9BF|nr:FtsW/RodA/SpoVE family cell cycle protein [Dysgonomonas sp. 511]NDV79231.1 FtsW/RodA/SpoVE family cell cycle protein [Dysgonomonas sp. 511]